MLVSRVLRSQMQMFDNEVSKVLLEFTENENFGFQLVPAHIHCKNLEELDIRT